MTAPADPVLRSEVLDLIEKAEAFEDDEDKVRAVANGVLALPASELHAAALRLARSVRAADNAQAMLFTGWCKCVACENVESALAAFRKAEAGKGGIGC